MKTLVLRFPGWGPERAKRGVTPQSHRQPCEEVRPQKGRQKEKWDEEGAHKPGRARRTHQMVGSQFREKLLLSLYSGTKISENFVKKTKMSKNFENLGNTWI